MSKKGPVSEFILKNYRHFNAATLVDAAVAYEEQLKQGNKMMITLAGAMSTAELGITLAEMIRQDKVHIITCTGANLEEDVFNLVAHNFYKRVPNYRIYHHRTKKNCWPITLTGSPTPAYLKKKPCAVLKNTWWMPGWMLKIKVNGIFHTSISIKFS
jgi:hypothetical protein